MEAQEVNDAAFREQVQPFVTRTGGFSYVMGTTLPDEENLLYSYYCDNGISKEKKIIYTWEEVYELRSYNNKKEAEKYKTFVNSEIAKFGLSSDYILTQYYCSFNIKGDKFITLEDLTDNDVFSGGSICNDLKKIVIDNEEIEMNHLYRIGAYDPALNIDIAALTIGISTGIDDINTYTTITKNLYALNKENKTKVVLSSDQILDRVANLCEFHNLDMIILDTTAGQIDRAYTLYMKLKERNIDTMVVPFSFANANKQLMMKYFEDSIYNKNFKLPTKKESEYHEDYQEAIKELLYLQKIKSKNKYDYSSPTGKNFHDDFPMSLALLNYCCKYVHDCYCKKYHVNLGGGINYRLKLHKNIKNIPDKYKDLDDLFNNTYKKRISHYI